VDIPIPVSRLRTGSNTFTFRFTGDPGFSPHVMYDYLRLELPAFPPPPPDSGRAIVWAGGSSAAANTWDVGTTPSFKHSGSSTAFGTGDAVIFDDSGSDSTSITLAGSLEANAATFSGGKNRTLAGTGSLDGTMKLEKSGTGMLTLSGANGFSGGTTILEGTLAISHAGALGSGTVSLLGGTLSTGTVAPANPIVVTAASTISGGSGNGSQGIKAVSGSAPLTLHATSVFDLEGTLSSFSGAVFLTGSGSFRLAGSDGSSAASFDLGSRRLEARNGGTYRLGSLTGLSGAVLGVTGTSSGVTFTVGGNGESTVFPGTVTNGSGTTHLIKTGAGTFTLSGTSTHTGATTVSQGTLKVTGALGATAVTVHADATLHAAGALPIASLTLLPSSNTVIEVGPAALPIQVAGALTLDGELRIDPAPGTTFGRFPLITHGGIRTGNFEITSLTGGFPHHLAYAPVEVVLFIDDSDEDGLPDTWELDRLDGLMESATGDADGDGTSNLAEQRLGLDPADGASSFRAACSGRTLEWPSAPGVVFTVKRNFSLDPEGWVTIGTVTGGAGNSATFMDADSFGSAFYRIEFAP
jgi:autotransporter-associated beta strand protein